MNVDQVLGKVDWRLLQNQKLALLNAVDQHPELEGLVQFLDNIQDAAVAQNIATEEQVFGVELKSYEVTIRARITKTLKVFGDSEQAALETANDIFDVNCTGIDEDYDQEVLSIEECQ